MSKNKTTEAEIVNVEQMIEDSISEWAIKNNPDEIRSKIHNMLDRNLTDLVMQTMGFKRDTWARGRDDAWEVNRTNGADRTSLIGEMIANNATSVAQDWVSKQKVTIDDIPEGLDKAFKKAVFEKLQWALREEASRMAQEMVSEYTKGIAEQIDLTKVQILPAHKVKYRSHYDDLDWDADDEDWDDESDEDDVDEDDMSDINNWGI